MLLITISNHYFVSLPHQPPSPLMVCCHLFIIMAPLILISLLFWNVHHDFVLLGIQKLGWEICDFFPLTPPFPWTIFYFCSHFWVPHSYLVIHNTYSIPNFCKGVCLSGPILHWFKPKNVIFPNKSKGVVCKNAYFHWFDMKLRKDL